MRVYKFLARGAHSPFSGFGWPVPGAAGPGPWIEAVGDLRPGVNGLHVCRASELAHWLHEELWEVEADGESVEGLDCRVVRRARLRRRVVGWEGGGVTRFTEACVERARGLAGADAPPIVDAFLSDAQLAAGAGYFAVGVFCAAVAVSKLHPGDEARVFRAERRWQGEWLESELLAVPAST